MGTRGVRTRPASDAAAAATVAALEPLGGVTSRAMFGGHGIFRHEVMFAIVDSEGQLYFRVDPTTERDFEEAGSTQHARMPYWEVPEQVRDDAELLLEWGRTAADVAGRGQR